METTAFDSMRKLTLFALASMLVHLAIVADIRLPTLAEDAPPLRVRLQPAPALPPALPRAAPRVMPQTAAAPAATPAPASAPVLPGAVAAAEPYDAPAPVEAAAPPAPEPTVAAPVAEEKPALARRLPRKGEITYQVYLGTNRFNIGRTLQSWTISDDRYRLRSVSETAGLAALFSDQALEYESSGRLTANGLQPDSFSNERRRGSRKDAATARFDWSAQTLTFGEPQRSAPLAADAQDLVSFMYQLGLLPLKPGRLELPITNGWKFERYALEVGAEEALDTPFGPLRAVPVRQLRRGNDETIELWLAPAYRWLPVRIRFFGRDGEPTGEQLVADIRVSDE